MKTIKKFEEFVNENVDTTEEVNEGLFGLTRREKEDIESYIQHAINNIRKAKTKEESRDIHSRATMYIGSRKNRLKEEYLTELVDKLDNALKAKMKLQYT
jgi:predicted lactoylglutathione lyase